MFLTACLPKFHVDGNRALLIHTVHQLHSAGSGFTRTSGLKLHVFIDFAFYAVHSRVLIRFLQHLASGLPLNRKQLTSGGFSRKESKAIVWERRHARGHAGPYMSFMSPFCFQQPSSSYGQLLVYQAAVVWPLARHQSLHT